MTASDYKTFYIRSRKNGATFNSITGFTSDANWITVTSTTSFTYSISENTNSSSRTGTLTLTQGESGKKCYIVITQQGADVEEWRYTFDVTPTALTFGSTGGSQSLTVTCYKTKWINDVEQPSTKTPVDWYSEPKNSWLTGVDAPNSQGGGVGSCGIDADANSGIYRSGVVTIVNSETNFSVRIIINQAAYVPDVYVFTWKDGSTSSKIKTVEWHQIAVRDISGEYEVISTKNGSSHPYSLVSKPSWVTSASISGVRLTIDVGEENTSATDRTGNLIFEQDDSGKRLVIVFTQKGQDVSYEFAWNAPNPTLFTHTVIPGTNMATVLAQDLISQKSPDGWATSSLVGATVTTKPSWLTVSLQQNQLDKMISVILSGTATTTPGTYPVIITQDESGEAVTMNIVVEADLPENQISITSASCQNNKYSVYFKSTYPVTSDVGITWSLRKDGLSGNTNYVVMKSGMDTGGVIEFVPVPWQEYSYVTIETLSPKSDTNYQYVHPNQRFPIEYSTTDRFEIIIDNNATGAPIEVTFQGGDSGTDREPVPIGGTLGSGYADLYVNGIVNLKHDYASGDYFIVRVSYEDGSTGWNSVTWSEQGATSSLNGKLYNHNSLGAGEVQMIVNTNIDGSIDEGTFGVLNFELRDGKMASIIFEHHPNL